MQRPDAATIFAPVSSAARSAGRRLNQPLCQPKVDNFKLTHYLREILTLYELMSRLGGRAQGRHQGKNLGGPATPRRGRAAWGNRSKMA